MRGQKNTSKLRNSIKKDYTRDFNDIEYFIDHVEDYNARIDVIEKMGYKTGFDVVNKETDIVKKIIVGKRGELRIQITPALHGMPLAKCVILD